MEAEKINVNINEEIKKYNKGIACQEIVKEYQENYANDIILVLVNGKLQELHKQLDADCHLEFVTTGHKPGMQSYQRSVILLMMKSIYDTAGHDNIEKVNIDFAISRGLYIRCEGNLEMNEQFLQKVKARMKKLVEDNLPIMKRSVHTDEAVELFHRHRMYDKEKLFNYRRVSKVNIYSINDFEDYYYGYMCPSTGYLKYFDLFLYEEGFVLQLPIQKEPTVIPPFKPQQKLFQVLNESSQWGQTMDVPDVGSLNDRISKGGISELILVQEALLEKKLGEIAATFARQRNKKFIMIAGPSSSGKTTFSHRLSIQLLAHGLKPHPIALDNYFINREDTPKDEDGNYNYEALECIDLEQFNKDMSMLLNGATVEMPVYNFIAGKREYKGDYLTLGEDDILVIEGIHGLNSRLSEKLPEESKYKIYLSALTQLNIDERNYIPTTDGRLLRRMVRDARTRGSSAQRTISMWQSVRRGEEENIFPYQEEADIMFNSALIYELSVLKQYAEPLLFSVPKDSAEFLEAKRLLKFLDYFLGVSSEEVPNNSILREFIGGSCFKV